MDELGESPPCVEHEDLSYVQVDVIRKGFNHYTV